jgi:hypothetical protein
MDRQTESDWTPERIQSLVSNPIYTGIGPYPALVTDDVWIAAAIQLIAEEGPDAFLRTLLQGLREAFPATDDH